MPPDARAPDAHKNSVGGNAEDIAGQFMDALCMRPVGAHDG
jgi:hypothetical protein